LSVYSEASQPLAWAGRVTDLPKSLVTGLPAVLTVRAALGPRLVRVDPVSLNSRNVGVARDVTVVVEKSLADPRETPGPADTAVMPTSIVPVTVRTPFATRGVAPDIPTGNYTFSVLAPISGAVLADAEVSRQDVRSARSLQPDVGAERHDLFAALLLAIGPLSRRQTTKSTTE
jgi:hypothetical protein